MVIICYADNPRSITRFTLNCPEFSHLLRLLLLPLFYFHYLAFCCIYYEGNSSNNPVELFRITIFTLNKITCGLVPSSFHIRSLFALAALALGKGYIFSTPLEFVQLFVHVRQIYTFSYFAFTNEPLFFAIFQFLLNDESVSFPWFDFLRQGFQSLQSVMKLFSFQDFEMKLREIVEESRKNWIINAIKMNLLTCCLPYFNFHLFLRSFFYLLTCILQRDKLKKIYSQRTAGKFFEISKRRRKSLLTFSQFQRIFFCTFRMERSNSFTAEEMAVSNIRHRRVWIPRGKHGRKASAEPVSVLWINDINLNRQMPHSKSKVNLEMKEFNIFESYLGILIPNRVAFLFATKPFKAKTIRIHQCSVV